MKLKLYVEETFTTTANREHIEIDTDKFRNGPISVDIKYKAGAEKAIKQNAKLVKQEKKTARQMKKINERNK